jgi:hypothetical protein
MTIARAHLVDPSVSRWYHCITRCVAFVVSDFVISLRATFTNSGV